MPPLQPSFASLGVPSDIVAALDRKGITEPFPIQSATIPDALAGRDVCGKAPTGSGKTLAFGIGAVARLTGKPSRARHPRVLVLAPTRELAAQVATELQVLATPRNLRVDSFYGGVGYGPQLKALSRGVDVAVACPGRLGDLIERGSIRLDAVEIVVIDEADRMADMGFLPDVRRLLDLTPANRQTLLYSATLDGDIDVLVRRYQDHPARHELEGDEDDANAAVHLFWKVSSGDRVDTTADVVAASGPTIVFCRTKHSTDRIARQLEQRGVRAAAIHGDRSQKQRERALDSFVRGAVDALVATDVAARGIHVDGVNAVVHFDPPADAKDYVHRSGRTARAGATGVVVSLVTPDKAAAVKRLQRDLDVPMGTTPPDLAGVTGVIGEAPRRRPAAAVRAGSDRPSRPQGRQPDRFRRTTKPWKARPAAGRNGSSGNGTGHASERSSENGSGGGVAASGHTPGGPKKPGSGAWEHRGKPARPGKPAPKPSGKSVGKRGAAPSTSRRAGSGGGHGTAGGQGGGSHGQRRRGPVGAKRGTGGSGGSRRGR
ncbi:MAG TPA: DEAD/DEAH box helicase [Acidimicrobiales bacterium]|jgi:superfamily II DNA/RNA helicase|nr:DEAD/DEAH box helicase [Acidimicrobiales bacterium]